jgi:SAM-dependent methyltransferase
MCNYPGTELEIFAEARTWKRYFRAQLRPFVRGRVLEVGAGIGANTPLLWESPDCTWTCLEPDPQLAARLAESAAKDASLLPGQPELFVGFVGQLAVDRKFDAILYIDVLEHIEDDQRELREAAQRLAAGGHLIVLSPAWPFLYSPFDRAIGHYRRYTRRSLLQAAPAELSLEWVRYLDSAGMLASLANRWLLRSPTPSARQIGFWDRVLVPVSKRLDPVVRYQLGKTVVGVWRRPEGG